MSATHRDELARFLRSRRDRVRPEDVGLAPGPRRRLPGLRREEVALLAAVSSTWYTRLADQAATAPPLEADLSPVELATLLVRHGETSPFPLYAFNLYCDLIAWNQAATTYYTDFAKLPVERQNMMWWLIATAEAGERLADWETDTRDIVARWRKVTALMADTRRLEAQVAEYKTISPQFAAWWDSHDVREHHSKLRRMLEVRVPAAARSTRAAVLR
jgi:hypothetical protein